MQHLCHRYQVACLVVGVTDASDVLVDDLGSGKGHGFGRRVVVEEGGGDHVDPTVGTLGTQDDGHKEFEWSAVVKFGFGYGHRLLKVCEGSGVKGLAIHLRDVLSSYCKGVGVGCVTLKQTFYDRTMRFLFVFVAKLYKFMYFCNDNDKKVCDMYVFRLLLLNFVFFLAAASHAKPAEVSYDEFFEDRTLRVDYIFCGTNSEQSIWVDELCQSEGWYGRRIHLDSLLLAGNGQITVRVAGEDKVIYRHSFSTLFQEWQGTEEATRIKRSFENVFLLPFPKRPVDVEVTLTDTHNRVTSTLKHTVNPNDILIRKVGLLTEPWYYGHRGGDPREVIDVAIVGDGYAEKDSLQYAEDVKTTLEAFLQHEPFKSLKNKFNFIVVEAKSNDSGVSVPHEGKWFNTVLGSHFDTFYSERYLTTLRLKKLHDVLAGVPYEHVIILANTDVYGGGGIFNSYMLSTTRHKDSRPVLVHEFGHSFGGLADEYYYDDEYEAMYPTDTEPWEPNITTLVDFDSKWRDMLPKGTKIPTKADGKEISTRLGVYEGAGNSSKGVYRPVQECRMKVNKAPGFCPVCDKALRKLVDFYVGNTSK